MKCSFGRRDEMQFWYVYIKSFLTDVRTSVFNCTLALKLLASGALITLYDASLPPVFPCWATFALGFSFCNLYICIYMHTYIYAYYIYIYIYIYIFIEREREREREIMYIYVCVSIYLYLSLSLSIYVYIYVLKSSLVLKSSPFLDTFRN